MNRMPSADIASAFYAADRLEQKTMNWLRQRGVTVPAMVDPDPVLRARIAVVDAGYFDIVGPEEDGVGAFLILARDIAGEVSDIIAWLPKAGTVHSWLGAAACLGEDSLAGPRLNEDGSVPVWRSPLDWLRAGRHGVVIVDPAKAAGVLSDFGPLVAEDVEHGLHLRSSLARPAPRILVRSNSQVAA